MAISRMWLKKMGNSRQACEFDFLEARLVPCCVQTSGSFSEQPFKEVKAFTDIGNVESMSKDGAPPNG